MAPRHRPLGGLALVLVLGLVAGCDSTSSTAGPSATPTATAPTATELASESPTASPTPAGDPSPEDAIRTWMTAQGLGYSGDCETGTRQEGTYCSARDRDHTVSSGLIYFAGPINSEAAYWLLLRDSGGTWAVVDWATFSDTPEPPESWT